jgi:hypothetical protein
VQWKNGGRALSSPMYKPFSLQRGSRKESRVLPDGVRFHNLRLDVEEEIKCVIPFTLFAQRMSYMSEALHYRNVLAGLSRRRPDDHEAILEARQAMKTAKIATYVERLLAEAPPLRTEQIDRIVGLLHAARNAPDAGD